jgi:hypothetical protein
MNEESKGLWYNIRAKRARGEKPSPKGSKAYKSAVAAAKKINAMKKEDTADPYDEMTKMSQFSGMSEEEPAQTTTTGDLEAMPIGFYEQTMCNSCALRLLEDIKAGKYSLTEAEYKGRDVQLGKPMKGDVKKYKVYVKNDSGNVIKVNFGDKNLSIKRDNPTRRKSFRARHKCSQKKDRTSAGYWSCRMWSSKPVSKILKGK